MSKQMKIWLAVALALIIAGAALLALGSHRVANWTEFWKNASFSFGGVSSEFTGGEDFTICSSGKESFPANKIRSLDIGWSAGLVTVEPGSGNEIRVQETGERPLKDEEKLCWKLEDGKLTLRYCSAAVNSLSGKNLTVTVPANWRAEEIEVGAASASVELRGLAVDGKLDAGATSGSIRVTACACDRLALGATSGSLYADECVCGRLEAAATSGSVKLQDCACDTLEAGSTSGSIAVRCDAKAIKLGATSGSVRCEAVPAGCDVDIGTTSGKVRLSLQDASDDQSIKISVTSGDVYLDAPGPIDLKYDSTSGDLRGSLTHGGSGCPSVKVDATSGDLILGKFD